MPVLDTTTQAWVPSTVPLVKAGLMTLFRSIQLLNGVAQDYGDPGVGKIQREHVFLGGTGEDDQQWAPAGQLKREEKYTIELFVHVNLPGSSQQQVTERAYRLAGAIELALRPLAKHCTQLAPDLTAIAFKPRRLDEFVTDQGHVAFLTNDVAITARI
jgi:hypothetical protein